MAYFIALGILSLAGIVGTVWLIRTDGYGRIPTDPRRAAPREPREKQTEAPRETRRAASPDVPRTVTSPIVVQTP
ncbi:hypothetical protein MTE01_27520 [Microbacterium testaceum]|uniref:Uncharacterized protein n=1 Tax=Microbacterium testaceum TaxID=2033 RepID=A0A4Y3QPW8_MICTE|nr:hypothetical protein [Microbacterium testaceum]GEB46807.1 hypothetical protein MTE01_27520 [Microbacterium testaceum]